MACLYVCAAGLHCRSPDSTLAGSTAFCTGACHQKIADGQVCDSTLLVGGQDDTCKSGKCLVLLAHSKNVRYCQPKDPASVFGYGSTETQKCTQDKDCALGVGSGLWCKGGSASSIGKCQKCPEQCPAGGGCSACDNDPSKMKCGRTTTAEMLNCAADVAKATLEKFAKCLGSVASDFVDCAEWLVGVVNDCEKGAEHCEFWIGNAEDCPLADLKLAYEKQFSIPERKRRSTNATAHALKQPKAISHATTMSFGGDNNVFNVVNAVANGSRQDEPDVNMKRKQRRANQPPMELTASGGVTVESQTLFKVNPLKQTASVGFTLAKLNVNAMLKISTTTGERATNKEILLGTRKRVFKKFFMVGYVPVFILIDVQAVVSYELSGGAEFNGEVEVTAGLTNLRANVSLDIPNLQINAKVNEVVNTEPAMSTTVTVTPQAGALGTLDMTARIGARWTFSVNAVPIRLDTMFGVSMSGVLAADVNGGWNAGSHDQVEAEGCVNGTITFDAGIDTRLGVDFAAIDAEAIAHATCMAGAAVLDDSPGKALANCVAGLADVTLPEVADLCKHLDPGTSPDQGGPAGDDAVTFCDGAKSVAKALVAGEWVRMPVLASSMQLEFCGTVSNEGATGSAHATAPELEATGCR